MGQYQQAHAAFVRQLYEIVAGDPSLIPGKPAPKPDYVTRDELLEMGRLLLQTLGSWSGRTGGA